MEVSEAGQVCPKCSTSISSDEKFCSSCGASLAAAAPDAPPVVYDLPPAPGRLDNLEKIGKARKWLLIVAILTCVLGMILYFVKKDEVEKQISDAQAQVAGIDPEVLDERMKEAVGMTFQEAIDHDRGMVRMLLVINLALTGAYLLLWWWAKRKPLPATVIALLLFVTTHVVNAVVDPTTIYQGVIVKIFFTLALVRAITAAAEERRLGSVPA